MKKVKPYFHPKSLVDSKSSVGAGTRVWAFAHVMKGAVIGRDCNIGDHAFIETGSVLGDRVTIKNGVSVWQSVTIGDDVFVGPNAVFTNDLWPISRARCEFLPTRVEKGVCVGANATLVCGIIVGEYAFIGAGSTVTKDVAPHSLVYGNPARSHGFLCRCRKKLKFKGTSARCACGLKFKKVKNTIRLIAR